MLKKHDGLGCLADCVVNVELVVSLPWMVWV